MAETKTPPPPPKAGPEPKIPKMRSPNFPSINLESAVSKTDSLYQAFKRHPMPIAKVMEKLDYKPDGSVGQQAIAALKSFGLIQVDGMGAKRIISVTEDGEKIVRNHPDRAALLRTAAVKPRINRELWDKFFGIEEPAPEEVVRQYLVWDRPEAKFNEAAVTPLLKQFRDTISFAKVTSSDTIEKSNQQDDDEDGGNGGDPPLPDPQQRKTKRTVAQGSKQDVFTLDEGQVLLEWPSAMSKDSFDDFKAWIEIAIRKIGRSVVDSEPNE